MKFYFLVKHFLEFLINEFLFKSLLCLNRLLIRVRSLIDNTHKKRYFLIKSRYVSLALFLVKVRLK